MQEYITHWLEITIDIGKMEMTEIQDLYFADCLLYRPI